MFLTISTLAVLSAIEVSAADAKAGKTVYQSSCKGCHGPTGAGNPAVAKMMKVEIKDLKSPDVQAISDDDIKKIITGGKGKMPAVTAVTGAAVDNVIAYVRSLKK
jgi:cytochrome c oxidase cbb3-type subunit 3